MMLRATFAFLLVATVLAHESQTEANKWAGSAASHFGETADDEEHIRQHLEGKIKAKEKLTPAERIFYYFQLYDLNKDKMLDGTELYKVITHSHREEYKSVVEDQAEAMIDEHLSKDDKNGDGYIDWSEFSEAENARLREREQKKK